MHDPALIATIGTIIREVALTPPDVPISAQTRLVEDLGVDSFDMASIIFSLQDHFDLSVRGDELPPINKVSELAEYISEHSRTRAA